MTVSRRYILSVISALLCLLIAGNAYATVGGSTTIDRLSYSSQENSLYYRVDDKGGRGCPPLIEKLDLMTKVRTQLKTCDEILPEYFKEQESQNSYDTYVQNIFRDLEAVRRIKLASNGISVVVEYMGEQSLDEYNKVSSFQARVFQGNQQKGQIDYMGCHQDQPHVFSGYIIPNTTILALLVSRVGDCIEGGYTKEDVYLIDHVTLPDSEYVMVPNLSSQPGVYRGDLVVYAQKQKPEIEQPVQQAAGMQNHIYLILVATALILVVLGFFSGYIVRARREGKVNL